MIPIHLNENADCPQFMNDLLAQALSVEQIETLQKYCGMALLGYNLSQQFIILEGTAGGGKSTIAKIICDVIGEDNVATLRSDMLAERFEMSAFCGKTQLIANDVNSDYMRKKGAGVIKSLTGADTLDVEFKGSNKRVRLKGNFCIAITTNARLQIRLDEDGDAWLRRLVLIRFTNNTGHTRAALPIGFAPNRIVVNNSLAAGKYTATIYFASSGFSNIKDQFYVEYHTSNGTVSTLTEGILLDDDSEWTGVSEGVRAQKIACPITTTKDGELSATLYFRGYSANSLLVDTGIVIE